MRTIATEGLLSGSIYQQQIELEGMAQEAGLRRYRENIDKLIAKGKGALLQPAERLLVFWVDAVKREIQHRQRLCRKGNDPNPGASIYGPAITMIEADRAAVISINVILSTLLSNEEGVSFHRMAYAIGAAVVAQIQIETLADTDKEAFERMFRRAQSIRPGRANWWAKKHLVDPIWSRSLCRHLGSILFWAVKELASCGEPNEPFAPAFRHHSRKIGGKRIGWVKMDALLERWFDKELDRRHIMPRYLPMICPPFKWSEHAQGGYVKMKSPLIANVTSAQSEALEKADKAMIYAGIDAVGASSWSVNQWLYGTMKELRRQGGGVAGLPANVDLPYPDRIKHIDPDLAKAYADECRRVRNTNRQLWADREAMNQAMAVADTMGDREMWQPHRLDFRSRCYPLSAHLHHQNKDFQRGMLQCGTGKDASSPEALRWLMIHAANCWANGGIDKAPFDDRVQWSKDHLNKIANCGTDPIGDLWWAEAEDPWQFLAACRALIDPAAAAHLPVSIDGTCNGLQHYAAMMLDEPGAVAVNLLPCDRPLSVYSIVADALAGNVRTMPESDWLAKYANRAVVKQPVMTTMYSVTQSGMRGQIRSQLKKQGLKDKEALSRAVAVFLEQIPVALGNVCTGASLAMEWLRDCAEEIVSQTKKTVQWDTALGFTVVQPYLKTRKVRYRTIVQSIEHHIPREKQTPIMRKQVNGVAPNFIHSVDASHLLLTAIDCHQKGIWFGAVHDSFRTHAADMGRLGPILMEQFVALHERNLLADLRDQWAVRYPQAKLPELPPRGTLNLRDTLRNVYAFS